MRGCCSPGWVSAGAVPGSTHPSLSSFGKKVLRCCYYKKDSSVFPKGLPCDPARHVQYRGGSVPALPAPLPLAQGRLAHSPAPTGWGHRAHFACQCEHIPHRIFAGTFISLILNIPSECLSTISLGRLLYLLINLTDKRFSPISILTSFSLNYIPIP